MTDAATRQQKIAQLIAERKQLRREVKARPGDQDATRRLAWVKAQLAHYGF